jgi:poly(A) polymerase
LHRADALASGRSIDHVKYCEFLLSTWTKEDLNPEPLIDGHDLTRHGLEPGPQFKELLDAVREAQLDGSLNGKKEAIEYVDRLLAEKTKKMEKPDHSIDSA